MLPKPMLPRPDTLPHADYPYQVKWDGFRAIVSTEDGLQVRSRRGWNMTDLVSELRGLPRGLVLDGELVAFGDDGRPSFPLLSQRMLMRRPLIPVVLMIFDVLRVQGENAMCLPYEERHPLLERSRWTGSRGGHTEMFEDGETLLKATSGLGLEGVAAARDLTPNRYRTDCDYPHKGGCGVSRRGDRN